jgi:hypothetical protein
LLAPLGWLSFPAANIVWLSLGLVFIAAAIWQLASAANLMHSKACLCIFASLTLALSPFHTSVSQGQLTLAITAFAAYALTARARREPNLEGVLLALGATLKPQMVVAHGCYVLLRRQWRTYLAAGLTLLVLGAIGIARMEAAGIPWLESYRASYADSFAGMNNPAAKGLGRYIILSMPMLLHLFTDSSAVVQVATAAFACVAGALTLRVGRRLEENDPLLLYSLLGELSLLVAYHRIYDATLLIFPMAWSMGRIANKSSGAVDWATLCMLSAFIPSGTAVLIAASQSGMLPMSVTNSWAWRLVILPHAVWLVLGLFVLHLSHALRSLGLPVRDTEVAKGSRPGVAGPSRW